MNEKQAKEIQLATTIGGGCNSSNIDSERLFDMLGISTEEERAKFSFQSEHVPTYTSPPNVQFIPRLSNSSKEWNK